MGRRLKGIVLGAALAAAGAAAAQGRVAIDVGHYLARAGATSAHGVTEFDYNQSLAAVIAARLAAAGGAVQLIGQRGDMSDLQARPREAQEGGADFFLSIHHDSVHERHLQAWVWQGQARHYADDFAGFSLYVSRLNPQLADSLACAAAIGAALREAGLPIATHHAASGREWADASNGVYYYDNLVVLKTASMPAVLLEAGVIVNRQEERALATPERRALTAAAVESGLRRCGILAGAANQSAQMRSEKR